MKGLKSVIACALAGAMTLTICAGCSTPSYSGFSFTKQGESELSKIRTEGWYIERKSSELKAETEKTLKTFSSDDGICVIEKKQDYYDVTLDLEKGSGEKAGRAYAQAIQKACPEYKKVLEGYLFENINSTFGTEADPDKILTERINTLKAGLEKEYREELEGFGKEMGQDKHGIKNDGVFSCEEAMLVSMVPDALRATSCSVMTVNGNKTSTGHRIAARMLEWDLGTEKQLCKYQSVTHFKNGKSSFTSIAALGMLDILTAINSSGVVVGELDVGSYYGEPFVSEGKICYSFDLRYVMENCTTAKKGAEFIASRGSAYTYNMNFFVADDKDALCVEVPLSQPNGSIVIRDSSTPLNDGLSWSDPDCMCIVNSFAAKGNADQLTNWNGNYARWEKYNNLFCGEKEKISMEHFKALMTSEKTKDSPVYNFRSENVMHMAVFDFESRDVQVLYGGKENPDEINFIDLGKL